MPASSKIPLHSQPHTARKHHLTVAKGLQHLGVTVSAPSVEPMRRGRGRARSKGVMSNFLSQFPSNTPPVFHRNHEVGPGRDRNVY